MAGLHFQKIYESGTQPGYIKSYYDTTIVCSGDVSRELMENNIISRIYNNNITTVRDQVLLPKAVVIVLEDDLLKATNHYRKGKLKILMPLLNWLASNLFSETDNYNSMLLTKSTRFKYPQFFGSPQSTMLLLD